MLGDGGWGGEGGLGDGFAYQGAGEDLGYADVYVAADRGRGVAREVDGLVLGAATGDLAPVVGAVFDHDGHDLV